MQRMSRYHVDPVPRWLRWAPTPRKDGSAFPATSKGGAKLVSSPWQSLQVTTGRPVSTRAPSVGPPAAGPPSIGPLSIGPLSACAPSVGPASPPSSIVESLPPQDHRTKTRVAPSTRAHAMLISPSPTRPRHSSELLTSGSPQASCRSASPVAASPPEGAVHEIRRNSTIARPMRRAGCRCTECPLCRDLRHGLRGVTLEHMQEPDGVGAPPFVNWSRVRGAR